MAVSGSRSRVPDRADGQAFKAVLLKQRVQGPQQEDTEQNMMMTAANAGVNKK